MDGRQQRKRERGRETEESERNGEEERVREREGESKKRKKKNERQRAGLRKRKEALMCPGVPFLQDNNKADEERRPSRTSPLLPLLHYVCWLALKD